nr:retrotransposon protein, putative, Ty1-copia subclass [Tanacetum cinerariifolium]
MVNVYEANPEAEQKVSCYVNVVFQIDKDDTKSQSRYVFVLNGRAVDWKSAKQSTIAMSSIEAKYIDASEASMEAVWMRKFIDGLGNVMLSNKRPMEMLCDNAPRTVTVTGDRETVDSQEFRTADSGTDTKPLEKVKYDAEYNVFANASQHSKQPESINNTCVVEKVDSNVIPDSTDMCNNDIQTD